jgi:hypothetical protein
MLSERILYNNRYMIKVSLMYRETIFDEKRLPQHDVWQLFLQGAFASIILI